MSRSAAHGFGGILLASLLGSSSWGWAQGHKTLDAKGVARVEIESHYDDITVVPSKGTTMRVAFDNEDEPPRIEKRGNIVKVRGRDSALTISLPPLKRLFVATQHGDVRIRGRLAQIDAKSTSGDVNVEVEAGEEVSLTSLAGDIGVRGTMTRLRANVVAGRLTITAEVQDARLNSTADTVKFTSKLLPQRLDCRTVSGGVDLTGGLAPRASVRVDAVSGTVRWHRTNAQGYRLKAKSRMGKIRIHDTVHRANRQVITHVEGDGNADVTIDTFNGDIIIRQP